MDTQNNIITELDPNLHNQKITTEEGRHKSKHKKHKKDKYDCAEYESRNSLIMKSSESKRKHPAHEGQNSKRKKKKIKKEPNQACVLSSCTVIEDVSGIKMEYNCEAERVSYIHVNQADKFDWPQENINGEPHILQSHTMDKVIKMESEPTFSDPISSSHTIVHDLGGEAINYVTTSSEGILNSVIEASQTNEEKLFYSVLHKYAGISSQHVRKVKQELLEKKLSHHIQRGKWMRYETAQLKRNMENFVANHPDCDPLRFLFPYMYLLERKPMQYRTLLREFLLCLGTNIKRYVSVVFARATWIYFPGKRGKLSKADMKVIKTYKERQARPSFTSLGALLNRHRDTTRKAYLCVGNQNTGAWTDEEDMKLINAVNVYETMHNIQTVYGLGWVEISKDVQTRTAEQCRSHFLKVLRWREENHAIFRPPLSISDRIKLIEMICVSSVQEEAEIDWQSLLSHFPHAGSHSNIQSMWHRIKVKVPDYSQRNLDEITDYLAKYELPRLENKLQEKLKKVIDLNKDKL